MAYGRGWLIKPDPEKDTALKMGEWNQMKIKAQEDKVSSWLNGTQMVEFQDEKIGQGVGGIALQIHDGGGIKVKWKNLKMRLSQKYFYCCHFEELRNLSC